ncbi:MAG: hypothetical protein M0Q95_21335 [Porticoccaceae bacterium]|jgi:hypothetical protein|nr:hypothetical protein [Porticoccaceae bacterium]
MRYSEVFVPGGFPRHTYNPRTNRNLESRISEVADNLCKLSTVTGHTKSGKTVLVRNAYPPEESIWIDGGTVGDEEDFWSGIIDQLELFQSIEEGSSTERSSEIGAEGTAEANFLLVKGSGALTGKLGDAHGTVKLGTRSVSSRVTALAGLRNANLPVIIDDFHYIPRELQGSLVRALKGPIFDGLPVVLIAIPHRRYDALKVEKEMTGRLHPIEIPLWESDELAYIPSAGFPLLNCEISGDAIASFTDEAIGSPHLMQDFCRTLCRQEEIKTDHDGKRLSPTKLKLAEVYKEVAETIGRPIFEKLARGPRQRTDRIPRILKDGSEVDIYGLVLHALAHIRPGLVTIEYEELRAAIREVAREAPQLHEVARVLRHMASIAASDESSTPVIDFEEEEKILHITDPFFAFYLRWGNLKG